ncbi:MAG: hypothetical protein LUE29_05415 [Lachnospiraceae bacterium]|nr:hypothetical protein [Lachnospiraceae bacterium]
MGYATLSNKNQYTIFEYDQDTIVFLSPYSLEYYTDIKEWDHGYIVVMAKYRHNKDAEEEYIDLNPILESLYYDVEDFLKPIQGVKLKYDQCSGDCRSGGHDS